MTNPQTGYCVFPLCSTINDKGSDYCLHHRKYFGVPNAKKSKQPIAPVSAKRKEENKEYKKVKAKILKSDNRCKIKSTVCTGQAQGLDHLQKRSPSNLTKESNLIPACNPCNLYKENNPGWAKANGFSISRFQPVRVIDQVNDQRLVIVDPFITN